MNYKFSDEEEDEDCDEKEQDDFLDLLPGVMCVMTPVRAKKPWSDVQPLKPALKQLKGAQEVTLELHQVKMDSITPPLNLKKTPKLNVNS